MTDRRRADGPQRDARRAAAASDGVGDGTTGTAAVQVERFADAWAAVSGGAPLDDVLASVADDAELVGLVRLAASASALLPATVSGAARARQSAALRAIVPSGARSAAHPHGALVRSAEPSTRRRMPGGWLARWTVARPQLALRLAAVVAAVALGLGSSVVASADDLPGDPLYGVKRAAESARLALTFDPARRAAFHVELAELRIAEIRALVNRGRNPSARVVEALIVELSSAATEADAAGDGALIARVRSARDAAARSLGDLAGQLSAEAAGVLYDGMAVLAPTAPPAVPPPDADTRAPRREPHRPRPTAAGGAATPTAVEALDIDAARRAATDLPAATPRPFVVGPTASVPTTEAGNAPRPGGSSGSGGGSVPPPVDPVVAPTSASAPQATEPPPDVAPTAVNPFEQARETALSTQPPRPTKVPTEARPRP